MQGRSRRFVLGLIVVAVPTVAMACYWDHDTVKQERLKFPLTLELITGKFLRHSPEFYQWRIEDRLKRLAKTPHDLNYLDDLGVAYQKTGQHEKAVETMLKKEALQPGLYETYSNLGTFYIINGDLEKGLPYIDQALEINPDAHFGREKYQKWLAEYAIEHRTDGKLQFPLLTCKDRLDQSSERKTDWRSFLQHRSGGLNETEALMGIQGMMRFANHDNPLLLETLGDLLASSDRFADAQEFAVFCYLQASYSVQDPRAKEEYRKIAELSLTGQKLLTLKDLEHRLRLHLDDAESWYAAMREQELSWIREGKNADLEYDQMYYQDPHVGDPGVADEATLWINSAIRGDGTARIELVVGAVVAGMVALVVFSIWQRRKTRRTIMPAA